MLNCAQRNYHPLTNTAITTTAAADLTRLIEACGHRPRILVATGVAPERRQGAAAENRPVLRS
jgi:hypothetical protein